MDVGDIVDILLDGDDKTIRSFAGTGIWYGFFPNTHTIRVRHGKDIASACKVYFTPACVALYGNEHTF